MGLTGWVVVTDRGGHLHNAQMLLEQLRAVPRAVLTTKGPDLASFGDGSFEVYRIPYLFSWWGKRRILNPLKSFWATLRAGWLAMRLRPARVVSLGATDVVPFCFWARLLGAEIIHVECMNQVRNASIAGRALYPICKALYVQWPELLSAYGPKARYRGWVLGGS